MFDRIIAFSIREKLVVSVLVVALIGFGINALQKLPIDALPDITNNQLQILTNAPNLGTQEVELYITYPIELALKSIPDIIELRSVSRFGLSIVTVVFEDKVDIYWARNQVNERLKEAQESIPEGFGTPSLGPISTGLGEVYQYTVTAAPGYEDRYSSMDLRAIQDWIIMPELLGIPGVAEVNTLGGIKKEYEVSIDPHRIKAMDVTMLEILDALKKNNQNTGAAYIDKQPYVHYIRALGAVASLEDIERIVIKNRGDVPILIRDVATVTFGHTVRYGAATKDGKGEVVSSMVMMLKGENSAAVVRRIKDKVSVIRSALPEGVVLTPFLDRSVLVKRAIGTVQTNLIEGALIVIFILVLLIGNWRAGLIVASVIPLALLFAVSMMNVFGISGNLMSLGAIDFGLIVDGAVIIVEAIVHRLNSSSRPSAPTSHAFVSEREHEVYLAASKIRKSAAFGEIIILIVYLPILALVGIEGKMFGPMAQTVAFAIFGAFLLSLTYVPMMSALLLKKDTSRWSHFSASIIARINSVYGPIRDFCLEIPRLVLLVSLSLMALAIFLFTRLGGEFIPTLEEGDIATHIIIPPGSSLSQEIATTTKAEQLLLENFPEIKQVVSKIGSAEIATDPMPIEVADVMVILEDKKHWTSASTKEEMFERMEHVLDDLPGVTTEFSQPIQMRFNELMTGVRSDVGVKIFGADLERLISLGDEVVEILQGIEGVEDARAESVSGFPQITVEYDRDLVALYGLNIQDLNATVQMAFAGMKAGVVYEEEAKYDLVVRLMPDYRKSTKDIDNLYVPLPTGNQIPLAQIATIGYDDGPAQISRENGSRRITVGFNVRGRDVESVVKDLESVIQREVDLPPDYYVHYTGQFENLNRARARLSIAVPAAMLLIFVLLYFTFGSVAQSLLIFSAVPLAAIGGVLALWIRDMPFSISAGIGFIALFGVAVLNGIVLVSQFNHLKMEGVSDVLKRIRLGTEVRLRPVVMTAAVASLGFLPMALSTSAGAEVQKPLATVVIGGLITATLLTLIVLPILYRYLEMRTPIKPTHAIKGIALTMVMFCTTQASAQDPIGSVEEAISAAYANAPDILLKSVQKEGARLAEKGTYVPPKTQFLLSLGQMNTRSFDESFEISQVFAPAMSKALKSRAIEESLYYSAAEMGAKARVRQRVLLLWNDLLFVRGAVQNQQKQLVLAQERLALEEVRAMTGEAGSLEAIRSEMDALAKQREVEEGTNRIRVVEEELTRLIGRPVAQNLTSLDVFSMLTTSSPMDAEVSPPELDALAKQVDIARADVEITVARRKPEFQIGYFIQSIRGLQEFEGQVFNYNGVPRFHGIRLGLQVPIFGKGYATRRDMANAGVRTRQAEKEALQFELEQRVNTLMLQARNARNELLYYQNEVIPKSLLLAQAADRSYEIGEITKRERLKHQQELFEIENDHMEAIHRLNQINIHLDYYLNKDFE
ncbi:MAG: CusA/CzcA family heavy metal efflux RND transporter [Saprospiraceae bacterium]|nr:CusA/CzcA family heavy metal efflux RND transporter [Saprospiraceae bacterium]